MPHPFLYVLDRPMGRAEVLAELTATPARMRALFEGADSDLVSRPREGGEWSAFQVLCHMRDISLVYSGRFRWMALGDNPTMPSFDENAWVMAATDTPADVPAMLAAFAGSRDDLMRLLTRLPEAGWERSGQHDIMGTLYLDEYVRHQLAHEEGHLRELAAALQR